MGNSDKSYAQILIVLYTVTIGEKGYRIILLE